MGSAWACGVEIGLDPPVVVGAADLNFRTLGLVEDVVRPLVLGSCMVSTGLGVQMAYNIIFMALNGAV
ncbi:hypothetical protein [Iningainema tapete]|uniref:Uncharacterized protein n=1 Tax=Iningainema tapete BLCC-T55 TaxID=2748662 RepID=A0A8J7BX95_9CYAN|nr:hypothetical protein [Iningainema tapete]MBD2772518.1 hypothetical protein [Iningainema tapete BLCC-T55]